MKAAICQKHCEKLWGIHWKQMGFFSFNSEILSLSGTIKTNRGATQNVIKEELARLSLCPWAFPAWASVGAGRGGRGLVWDLPSAPSSTPGLPTGFANWWARKWRKFSWCRVRVSFGAPKRRSRNPISLRERGGLRGIPGSAELPTRSCPSELGQEGLGFSHLQVSTDTHISLHRVRDKDS